MNANTTYTIKGFGGEEGRASIVWSAKRSPWGWDVYRDGHLQGMDQTKDQIAEAVEVRGGYERAHRNRIAARLAR